MIYKKPNVGSIVRYTIDENALYAHTRYYYFRPNTKEGLVIQSEDWDQPGTFRVQTNNKNFPISVVTLSRLIDLVVLSGTSSEHADIKIRTFRVLSSRGKDYYSVTMTASQMTCTCMGFMYNHTCKHIHQVKQHLMNKGEVF